MMGTDDIAKPDDEAISDESIENAQEEFAKNFAKHEFRTAKEASLETGVFMPIVFFWSGIKDPKSVGGGIGVGDIKAEVRKISAFEQYIKQYIEENGAEDGMSIAIKVPEEIMDEAHVELLNLASKENPYAILTVFMAKVMLSSTGAEHDLLVGVLSTKQNNYLIASRVFIEEHLVVGFGRDIKDFPPSNMAFQDLVRSQEN